jgi:hypothetical protein
MLFGALVANKTLSSRRATTFLVVGNSSAFAPSCTRGNKIGQTDELDELDLSCNCHTPTFRAMVDVIFRYILWVVTVGTH